MALQPAFPSGGRRGALGGSFTSPAAPAVQDGESKLLVGPHVCLRSAEITHCDTLIVEGTLEAAMTARVMRIAERGMFKGSADVEVAEVRGQFEGMLTVRDRLLIHGSGQVSGHVRYGKLVIEEGARLSGEVAAATAHDAPPASAPPEADTPP